MLNRVIAPQSTAHTGFSGIHLVGSPLDAFAVRVLMLRTAAHSLDLRMGNFISSVWVGS